MTTFRHGFLDLPIHLPWLPLAVDSRYQWKEDVRIDAVLEAQHIERSAAQKAWDEKMRQDEPRTALDGVKFREETSKKPAITFRLTVYIVPGF